MLAILILYQAQQFIYTFHESDTNNKEKSKGEPNPRRLYVTGEYAVSHTVLLTDSILLHHWFVALMGIVVQNRFFIWLATLQNSSHNSINYVLLTIYVWFATPNKKPPDISESLNLNHMITNFMYTIKDLINYMFNKDVSIMFWSSFIVAQFKSLFKTRKETRSIPMPLANISMNQDQRICSKQRCTTKLCNDMKVQH